MKYFSPLQQQTTDGRPKTSHE